MRYLFQFPSCQILKGMKIITDMKMSNVIEEWEKACIHYWQISELSYIYTLIDLDLDIYLNANIQNEKVITQITEYIYIV